MTEISEASPYPLGVSLREGGINVAVMSRHAARVFFCLFEGGIETRRVALGSRLGDVHFGFIAGIGEGAEYGLRAEGPWEPGQGHRFDPSKLLLDPYAQELSGPFNHHTDLTRFGVETAELVPKAVVRRIATDAQPLPSKRPGFIYEVPVRAFTKLHPQVPPEKRGTVAALAEPVVIDHFKRLGVDTVELMPLMAWIDERHLPPLGLRNAWGYNPVSFFAPDPRLAPGGLAEVRQTVDALHAAGIRVILDVVFNHTGESDEDGATLLLRGLDNALYYRHAEGKLVNDTGCGNTLALDRAAGVQLAMDAMRSWVSRTGLDGFRFDLATVMGRRPGRLRPGRATAGRHRAGPAPQYTDHDCRAVGRGTGRLPAGRLSGTMAGMERPLSRRGAGLLERRGNARRLGHAHRRIIRCLCAASATFGERQLRGGA